ncbi:hypothetical protein FB451DRAFT_1389044 [Mycena latifolia]|nr:hypothetical protein FB451DRAFT_1389044 [Mycena latifolia]
MSFVPLFVLLSALPWLVASTFTFTSTTPTECDNVQISWTGGAGTGYYLSIIPVYDVPRNISIPSSAFSNGNGTFSTPMTFAENTQLVLTMSDSTGFGAGGSTAKLNVGKSLGLFNLPNYIERGAVAPVTIMGVIPGGDSFVLHPGVNDKTFSWVADVFNGIDVIFLMVDADLRSGGSALFTTSPSSDSSCINNDSPSSTIVLLASATSTTPPAASSSVPATPRSSTGAIAGSVTEEDEKQKPLLLANVAKEV